MMRTAKQSKSGWGERGDSSERDGRHDQWNGTAIPSTTEVKGLVRRLKDVGLDRDPRICRRIRQYEKTGDPELLEMIKIKLARARPPAHALADEFLNLRLRPDLFDPDDIPMGMSRLCVDRRDEPLLVRWPQRLVMLAGLTVGDIGSGKTNAGHVLGRNLVDRGYGLAIVDPRIDWVGMARTLPNCILVTPKTDLFNLIAPLPGVDIETVYSDFASVLCEALGLFTASKLFLKQALAPLARRTRETGHYPHLGHLRDQIASIPARPRTPTGDRKERTLERINGLIDECGEQMLFVESGLPYEEMLESHNIIFHSLYDQQIGNFLTYWRMRRLYLYRLHADSEVHRPVIWFLDECHAFLSRGGFAGAGHK